MVAEVSRDGTVHVPCLHFTSGEGGGEAKSHIACEETHAPLITTRVETEM